MHGLKEPQQLVLIFKGASDKTLKSLRKLAGKDTSFSLPTIDFLPSAYLPASVTRASCELSKLLSNPAAPECGDSKVRYYEVEPEKVYSTLAAPYFRTVAASACTSIERD